MFRAKGLEQHASVEVGITGERQRASSHLTLTRRISSELLSYPRSLPPQNICPCRPSHSLSHCYFTHHPPDIQPPNPKWKYKIPEESWPSLWPKPQTTSAESSQVCHPPSRKSEPTPPPSSIPPPPPKTQNKHKPNPPTRPHRNLAHPPTHPRRHHPPPPPHHALLHRHRPHLARPRLGPHRMDRLLPRARGQGGPRRPRRRRRRL